MAEEKITLGPETEESFISAFEQIASRDVQQNRGRISPGQKLAKDREALKSRMRDSGYSEEEIEIVTNITPEELAEAAKTMLDKVIAGCKEKPEKLPKKTVNNNPSFYHVAGQPGCGKTGGIGAIESSLSERPFVSEMDVYRTMHPRINAIKEMIAKKYPDDTEKQGSEFVAFTSLFADLLELMVVSYMISNGYNVVKETTGKNSSGICGMIEVLKDQYPNMSASMACMAVSQEVSIDGTKSRGETMQALTQIFVEDLARAGIKSKPVGRGTVSEEFSKATCAKIPGAMREVAESGLIDGEFIVARRGDEPVVQIYSGEEIKANAQNLEAELRDRITGEKARQEAAAHFAKKDQQKEKADKQYEMEGKLDDLVEIYLKPTVTWLKETDGAKSFYTAKYLEANPTVTGEIEIEDLARWVIQTTILKEKAGELVEMPQKENSESSKASELEQMMDDKDKPKIEENGKGKIA